VHIVFVCTGNTCRSPMAAQLLRDKVARRGLGWTVESAGLYALAGSPMSELAAAALRKRGIQGEDHRSQPVSADLVARADWILTMTGQHAAELRLRYPDASDKIHELARFVADTENAEVDIVDPFGGDAAKYEQCAQLLDQYVERLIEKLTSDGAAAPHVDSEERSNEDSHRQ
jgi:protein-tyrosine-phosphatase